MEQKVLPVVFSANSIECLQSIFEYGSETFSSEIALKFIAGLKQNLDELSSKYLQHAECRFLRTKSKKYRMFNFVSYLIIYRITDERVEVLTIIHNKRSINRIRAARRIRI